MRIWASAPPLELTGKRRNDTMNSISRPAIFFRMDWTYFSLRVQLFNSTSLCKFWNSLLLSPKLITELWDGRGWSLGTSTTRRENIDPRSSVISRILIGVKVSIRKDTSLTKEKTSTEYLKILSSVKSETLTQNSDSSCLNSSVPS